jgi:hypothetical protein
MIRSIDTERLPNEAGLMLRKRIQLVDSFVALLKMAGIIATSAPSVTQDSKDIYEINIMTLSRTM